MKPRIVTTFIALFKLLGLSEEGTQELGNILAYINNDTQDRLIALLTSELVKSQNLAVETKQK